MKVMFSVSVAESAYSNQNYLTQIITSLEYADSETLTLTGGMEVVN